MIEDADGKALFRARTHGDAGGSGARLEEAELARRDRDGIGEVHEEENQRRASKTRRDSHGSHQQRNLPEIEQPQDRRLCENEQGRAPIGEQREAVGDPLP